MLVITPQLYAWLFGAILAPCILAAVAIRARLLSVKVSHPALLVVIALAVLLTLATHPTWHQLGLAWPSLESSLLYAVVTVSCCSIMWLLSRSVIPRAVARIQTADASLKLIFYGIISAPAQEFLVRSFLYYSLDFIGVLNIFTMTILSGLLFGWAHLWYEHTSLIIGAGVMGLVWGLAYFIAPNLPLITVSHAVVGLWAFYLGLIKRDHFFLD